MTDKLARMLPWWSLAAVVGWFLLPASVESLDVAVKGLSEEFGVRRSMAREPLKLVGAAAVLIVLVVLWRRTTPRPARHHGRQRRPQRSSYRRR